MIGRIENTWLRRAAMIAVIPWLLLVFTLAGILHGWVEMADSWAGAWEE